ncbi:hypothetical protein DFS33DRAFT_1367994 [Desarmillaria ectypa]|nr:hypothetical protein DFS33DRAFT_1367994 [Desarmillaria ectypa]
MVGNIFTILFVVASLPLTSITHPYGSDEVHDGTSPLGNFVSFNGMTNKSKWDRFYGLHSRCDASATAVCPINP